jgi:hypothetical protein
MMPRPQTIQIFLPAGDPRGMRVAEITTRIVRLIEVPRSQLADFLKMPEAQQVGVYFLMGELSEAGLPRAYIGQSGNVGYRLLQHNQGNDRGKDFWNRALVVISLTNSMTQTHALFLEWFAIAEATKAGRYSLENGNTGSQPYTPAPLQADCHGIRGSADGVGEYTTEDFVVLKGSKGRIENVASIQGTSNVQIHKSLVKDGVMAPQDGLYVFTRDHLFPSPSQAAMALMGRSANGWVEWKADNGKTLDELKRQAVAAVG